MNESIAELITLLLFLLFVGITFAGGFAAVTCRRIIRSVAGLAVASIGLAGLYYFLNSPFLALMKILIYVGAVCVAVIFAVMLSEPDEAGTGETPPRGSKALGAGIFLVCSLLFAAFSILSVGHPWGEQNAVVGPQSVEDLGIALLTTYSLPFELISLVLLVAILGALVIARGGRKLS